MRIGFVSTWLERGATYVTKTYISLLEDKHQIFVYARGGEKYEKGNPRFETGNVTWGLRLGPTTIDWNHFSKWIKKNRLDAILFNEQQDILCVLKTKKYYPNVKIGAYVDYYTEDTISDFNIYDFLICNTRRHYSVFSWHPGAYYVPWGVDIDLFNFKQRIEEETEIVFFHSVGMSKRKGTDALINAYINGEIYKRDTKLIIHTQIGLDHIISNEKAEEFNIQIILKEVPAPGLYNMGDVYVYPTTLDGLGLTIYESLSCGLPVITTDCAPMNEVINDEIGKLVKVDLFRARKDGYYWPLAFVNESSLIEAMNYYCDNRVKIEVLKKRARLYAEKNLNIMAHKQEICNIFQNSKLKNTDIEELDKWIDRIQVLQRKIKLKNIADISLPNIAKHYINLKRAKIRK